MAVSEWVEASPTCCPNPDDSSMVTKATMLLIEWRCCDLTSIRTNGFSTKAEMECSGRRTIAIQIETNITTTFWITD